MGRADYIRDLAYAYLTCGPSASAWTSATDKERSHALIIVSKVSGTIVPPGTKEKTIAAS